VLYDLGFGMTGRPLLLSAYLTANQMLPGLWHLIARRIHTRVAAPHARQPERIGRTDMVRPDGPLIWVHAESVGEVGGIACLLHALAPHTHIVLTTNTQTGAERAIQLVSNQVIHQFKPADTRPALGRFLDHWRPDAAIFAENDMPPMSLALLKSRAIPTALIAARPSKTRRKAPRLAAALLSNFDLITASSQSVADELRKLGVRVRLIEDLKAFQGAVTDPLPWPSAQHERPIWLAVSTHAEDHELLFAAHDIVKTHDPAALLVIAPRHPSASRAWAAPRFVPVFFSDGGPPTDANGLFVMDAFGHLPRLHLLSHVSFIGGSLGKRGGHSPWEAASAGSIILTGPDIANNAPAYNGLEHKVVTTPDALADAVLAAWTMPRPAPVLRDAKDSQTARAVLEFLKVKQATG
jgi:3-deoxy-D-manno-octulosonic-acid transferase